MLHLSQHVIDLLLCLVNVLLLVVVLVQVVDYVLSHCVAFILHLSLRCCQFRLSLVESVVHIDETCDSCWLQSKSFEYYGHV